VSVFWLQRRLIAKGLGGAFLKTLSIYSGRCVVGYLEFERIRVKRNKGSWEQTPISDHFGVYTIL